MVLSTKKKYAGLSDFLINSTDKEKEVFFIKVIKESSKKQREAIKKAKVMN